MHKQVEASVLLSLMSSAVPEGQATGLDTRTPVSRGTAVILTIAAFPVLEVGGGGKGPGKSRCVLG